MPSDSTPASQFPAQPDPPSSPAPQQQQQQREETRRPAGSTTPSNPAADDSRSPLRRQVRELYSLFFATMTALLLLSLGVNLFIFRQMQAARTQLAASRSAVQTLTEQYQRKEPAMRQFTAELLTYAASHPEFAPILARYRPALPQFFNQPLLEGPRRTPLIPTPEAPPNR